MYSSTSLSFSTGAAPAMSSSSSSSSYSSASSGLRQSSPPPPASSSASSSLFNFSSYPAYQPPAASLESELDGPTYRGVDHSSSIFALPADSSLSMSTSALSLADFDSSDASSSSSSFPAFPSHESAALPHHPNKLDIPSFATLTDLSASDFPSSSPPCSFSTSVAASSSTSSASLPSPLVVSDEPSYLERYTSFYSTTPAEQLLTALTSTLDAHHIDYNLCRAKAKLVVSFQCPMLSSLTVSFILRLYKSATRPNTLIVEGQRREGCVVAFHHVWGRLVKECRAQSLCSGLVEEAQKEESSDVSGETTGVLGMCSLLGNRKAAATPTHSLAAAPSPASTASAPAIPALPCFQLDASASAILTNLVDNGDICQQRDALRLLALSLRSSPSAADSLLSPISRWAAPSSTPSASPDDERTAQLAQLMLTCSRASSPDAFIHRCAQSLFDLLDELLRQPDADMSMCRVRGLRLLLQVVAQLCRAQGGTVMKPYVGQQQWAVLERCVHIPDAAVQQESRAVLQQLAQAF